MFKLAIEISNPVGLAIGATILVVVLAAFRRLLGKGQDPPNPPDSLSFGRPFSEPDPTGTPKLPHLLPSSPIGHDAKSSQHGRSR